MTKVFYKEVRETLGGCIDKQQWRSFPKDSCVLSLDLNSQGLKMKPLKQIQKFGLWIFFFKFTWKSMKVLSEVILRTV